MRRLIIGITGASGVIYGIRLLEVLAELPDIETHLVISNTGKLNISIETDYSLKQVEALADTVHPIQNTAATISSGSFKTAGMIIAPCSMQTLSKVVHSLGDNLIARAADVILKEGRKLVLMPREVPLHAGHCKLLYEAALLGAQIAPPMPAFYNRPQSIEDVVDHSVGRILDLFDIESSLVQRWPGLAKEQ